MEDPVIENEAAVEDSAETERSKFISVCIFCGEEEGAWLVGAYTLVSLVRFIHTVQATARCMRQCLDV